MSAAVTGESARCSANKTISGGVTTWLVPLAVAVCSKHLHLHEPVSAEIPECIHRQSGTETIASHMLMHEMTVLGSP